MTCQRWTVILCLFAQHALVSWGRLLFLWTTSASCPHISKCKSKTPDLGSFVVRQLGGRCVNHPLVSLSQRFPLWGGTSAVKEQTYLDPPPESQISQEDEVWISSSGISGKMPCLNDLPLGSWRKLYVFCFFNCIPIFSQASVLQYIHDLCVQ